LQLTKLLLKKVTTTTIIVIAIIIIIAIIAVSIIIAIIVIVVILKLLGLISRTWASTCTSIDGQLQTLMLGSTICLSLL